MLYVPSEKLLNAVFHTLAYADVFDYPLTAPEVHRYLTSYKASLEEVGLGLTDKTAFAQDGEYFTLRGREKIIEVRKQRAKIGSRLWPKAVCYGRIIARLPFVRMVAITGSLSMHNADVGNDIDYMIVTAPNHLWSCRALALFIARIAKLEGISLCPNYLITTNALALKERSLYVAHEVAQMIPISGMETYDEMRQRNGWISDYLPNSFGAPALANGIKPIKNQSVFQRIMENIFSLPFGNWFEKWEMDRKLKRLTREQSSSFESYFSADICKGHIDKHGEHIATVFASRLKKPA